jgi:hypothetical protein
MNQRVASRGAARWILAMRSETDGKRQVIASARSRLSTCTPVIFAVYISGQSTSTMTTRKGGVWGGVWRG